MRFSETGFKGAFLIAPELAEDDRGFFARTFCQREFSAQGLNTSLVQCNISFNLKKGTLRGLHYQEAPHEETKLVRCTLGAIYDVIVDIRRDSPTFGQWWGVELSASNRLMLYVPEGFAHGFQTFEDNSEVFYQMSSFYAPERARGIRWNDPKLAIRWPHDVTAISDRDNHYPDFSM